MTDALAAIRDESEAVPLPQKVMRALNLCGIEAGYFVAPLVRDARMARVVINIGLSRVWERHYRARLHLIDPLPSYSMEFSNAFTWPEQIDYTGMTASQQRYMKIAARYGLARGIGVACYGPHGRTGFLGMAWQKETPPSDSVLLAVHQIGQVSFHRYCQIVRAVVDFAPLSNRELEVLTWMCVGKSNPAMAKIIGVSRSSIDAYIRRIFAKLDVTDRTAACVRAYSLGLVASVQDKSLVRRARWSDETKS